MKILQITFPIMLLLFVACGGQKDKGATDLREMHFSVDPEKLGPTFVDTANGYHIQPPINWNPLPDDIVENAAGIIGAHSVPNATYFVRPNQIFLNNVNGSLLMISQIIPADEEISPKAHRTQYREEIHTLFHGSGIMEDRFVKDGMVLDQFLIQEKDRVNFKFLFLNSQEKLIQVDFLVPTEVYIDEIKAIESSIGTIRLIN